MKKEDIRQYSLEDLKHLKDETDWEYLRSQGPYEGPQEFKVDWSTARLVDPTKEMISMRVDPDVLAFFRAQGKGYQTRMNAVLRAYVEAQKKPA